MEIVIFSAPKIRKNHDSQHELQIVVEFYVTLDLFLFHHGSDFLGFHGVDVAIGIAEAEGTIVAATHCEQSLHRKVETSHEFLGEG